MRLFSKHFSGNLPTNIAGLAGTRHEFPEISLEKSLKTHVCPIQSVTAGHPHNK
jgi:hypothetical protein